MDLVYFSSATDSSVSTREVRDREERERSEEGEGGSWSETISMGFQDMSWGGNLLFGRVDLRDRW